MDFATVDARSTPKGVQKALEEDRSLVMVGDAGSMLDHLPSRSARTVVTSPPYWSLRDYQAAGLAVV